MYRICNHVWNIHKFSLFVSNKSCAKCRIYVDTYLWESQYYSCIVCQKLICRNECKNHRFKFLINEVIDIHKWLFYQLLNEEEETMCIFGICEVCQTSTSMYMETYFIRQLKHYLEFDTLIFRIFLSSIIISKLFIKDC